MPEKADWVKDVNAVNKVSRFTTRDITLTGMMVASIEVAKLALSFLPNVELVSFLLMVYTLFFGSRIFFVIAAFVLIEGCMYGFGTWWIMYLYIWPLLAGLTLLFRRKESVWFWSIFSGVFGLFYGALCSLTYLVIGGPHMAFTWWVAGIPYDLIHCVSNFVLCFILFRPLYTILNRLRR